MNKGLFILSIILLTLCLLLSILMFSLFHVDLVSDQSILSLVWFLLGGLGLIVFMFEWFIVFPILFVLLVIIIVGFAEALRNKCLSKNALITLVSINSLSVILMIARAIGWFVFNASI